VIGTVEQFPTRDLTEAAVAGLRMSISKNRNRQRERSITVADLINHYIVTEAVRRHGQFFLPQHLSIHFIPSWSK
jgi:hypothetical protein